MSVDRRSRIVAEEEASKFGASVSFRRGRSHAIMSVHQGGQVRRCSVLRRAAGKDKERLDWIRQNVRKLIREMQCDTPKL